MSRIDLMRNDTSSGRQPHPTVVPLTETPKGQALMPAPTNGLSVSLKRFEKSASTGGHSGPPLHGDSCSEIADCLTRAAPVDVTSTNG